MTPATPEPPGLSSANQRRLRLALLGVWVLVIAAVAYLFLFYREAIQSELRDVMSASMLVAGFVYLLLSSLRGFTMMPAAPLLVLGIAFFPPLTLFLLTLAGILISSAIIYWFFGSLHLEEVFTLRYPRMMHRVKGLLHRRELPVIIAWCFFPVTPTDLLVFVCGVLRVSFKKTILGVAIGAGANCGIYIFLGDHLLRLSGMKV
ncbi:MAG: VTT domain-containing protein [Verrucomicrobiota bacterium]